MPGQAEWPSPAPYSRDTFGFSQSNRTMHPRPFDPARALRRRKAARQFTGGLIVAFGAVMLLSMLGMLPPIRATIRITIPVILIIFGAIIGVRTGFRRPAGPILILIGVVKLIPPFHIANGVSSNRLIIPVAIIIFGMFLLFRRRGSHARRGHTMQQPKWTEEDQSVPFANDNSIIDIDVTFGGRKEIVTAKSFKGGDVTSTFGGVELNLMQAAISDSPAILEVKCMFSGVEIIVPSHWEIQNEIQPTMGSVEDQRFVRTAASADARSVLILRGTCFCGAVEVKSY
jgi:predicted membrane protein